MKTISNYEILHAAYDTILDRWLCEMDKIDQAEAAGRPNEIAKHRAAKYNAQLNEIAEEMSRIEDEMRKEA